jgi:hypothetical protein
LAERPLQVTVSGPQSADAAADRFKRGLRFPYNPQVLQPARAGPPPEGNPQDGN